MKILFVLVLIGLYSCSRNIEQSLFDKMESEDTSQLKTKVIQSDLIVSESTQTDSLEMEGLKVNNNIVKLEGNTLLQLGAMRLTADQLQAMLNYYLLVKARCGDKLEKCVQEQQSQQMRFQQKKTVNMPYSYQAQKKEDNKQDNNNNNNNNNNKQTVSTSGQDQSEDQLDEQVDQLLD